MSLAGPDGGGGGLVAAASINGADMGAPRPVLVDTATLLTTFDSSTTAARLGGFALFSRPADGTTGVPRMTIDDVPLFSTPLAPVGIGDDTLAIGGVVGGDTLSRFAVGLDYRGASPSLSLRDDLRPCRCELSNACYAVMGFTLAGGQDTQLQGQTYVTIGNDLYTYPPSRVLLDACLEPLPDPLTATGAYAVCAGTAPNACPSAAYRASGADVRLVVATGFPGLGLSATAYDRLRGQGEAARLLAGPTVTLHLGDTADEVEGVHAAVTTLGDAPGDGVIGRSALALVANEGYFGPCSELARSRRLRRYNLQTALNEAACLVSPNTPCSKSAVPELDACALPGGSDAALCDDKNGKVAAAAVAELTTPLPVFVIPDLSPVLVSLNADLRPSQPSVDGLVGTTALARLVATVDYPRSRFVARCASDADCAVYAEIVYAVPGSCEGCMTPIDNAAARPLDQKCAASP